ncbi:hypothetical protein FACS1894152_4600 [Bacilli bacterium]|nr:hypothetical protein FACS1894152_4600 [Bacilli bacterium]
MLSNDSFNLDEIRKAHKSATIKPIIEVCVGGDTVSTLEDNNSPGTSSLDQKKDCNRDNRDNRDKDNVILAVQDTTGVNYSKEL